MRTFLFLFRGPRKNSGIPLDIFTMIWYIKDERTRWQLMSGKQLAEYMGIGEYRHRRRIWPPILAGLFIALACVLFYWPF